MRRIDATWRERDRQGNRSRLLVSIATLLLVALPLRSSSISYSFTRIVNDPGLVGTLPSINNSGTVVWTDNRFSDPQRILTSDGGELTTIADTSGPFSNFGGVAGNPAASMPDINDAGTVAFFANLDVGSEGIFTGDGITTTTIADTSGALDTFATFCNGGCSLALVRTSPAINNSGQVAFSATLDNRFEGIFRGDGSTLTTIVETSGLGPFQFVGAPDINDSGTVVFWANGRQFGNPEGIFASSGGSIATVVDDLTGMFSYFSMPSLNNNGTVAFFAGIRAESGGGSGIFIAKDGVITTVADTNGPFSTFFSGQVSLNDHDEVAFMAALDTGQFCVFRGGLGVAVEGVLCTGDSVFGRTAEVNDIFRRALNNVGQIVFLEGGGITRADPPRADVSVAKTDSPDPILVENELTYTLTVTNLGPDPANDVGLTDNLPGTVALLSVLSTQGSCSGISAITCELGTIDPEDTATITIRVATLETGTLSNTASVAAQERDPNPANDTATETTEVRGGADLTGVWVRATTSCTRRFFGFCLITRISGTFEVRNQGTRSAPSSTLSFFFSGDPVLDAGDLLFQNVNVGPLRAGETRRLAFSSLILGTATSQYAIAFVDATNAVPEADETNNKFAFGPLP